MEVQKAARLQLCDGQVPGEASSVNGGRQRLWSAPDGVRQLAPHRVRLILPDDPQHLGRRFAKSQACHSAEKAYIAATDKINGKLTML